MENEAADRCRANEIRPNIVLEEKISKLNTDGLSPNKPNKIQIRSQDSIPYHRTCGARFCPNGSILGKNCFWI